jgi:hypothetical protein
MPIENPLAREQRIAFGSRHHAYRHSALLLAIIAMLGVRPLISGTGAGNVLYSITAVIMLVVALYTIQVDDLVGDRALLLKQRKTRSVLGWTLAIIAIGGRLSEIDSPNHRIATLSTIALLAFLGFVTITELRGLFKHRIVTRETISMSISVYLLFGLT